MRGTSAMEWEGRRIVSQCVQQNNPVLPEALEVEGTRLGSE
jgi:hypothetical protein